MSGLRGSSRGLGWRVAHPTEARQSTRTPRIRRVRSGAKPGPRGSLSTPVAQRSPVAISASRSWSGTRSRTAARGERTSTRGTSSSKQTAYGRVRPTIDATAANINAGSAGGRCNRVTPAALGSGSLTGTGARNEGSCTWWPANSSTGDSSATATRTRLSRARCRMRSRAIGSRDAWSDSRHPSAGCQST